MSKRVFGMAPGGRMNLDRAAQRRRVVWHTQRKQGPAAWPVQRYGEKRPAGREERDGEQ